MQAAEQSRLFESVFAHAPTPTCLARVDGALIRLNTAARRQLGIEAGQDAGLGLSDLFQRSEGRVWSDLPNAAGTAGWVRSSAVLARGDLAGLRQTLRLRSLRDHPAAAPVLMICIDPDGAAPFREHTRLIASLNRELTRARALQAQLEQAVEREQYLHGELIHRVKNNLAVLSSLVRARIGEAQHDETREALRTIALRTRSIALVHDLLDQSNAVEVIDASDLIQELCRLLSGALVPENVTLNCEVEALRLHNADATALCILINELVTNALKYAFTGKAEGRIDLVFRQNGVDRMELRVRDDGRGMAEQPQPATDSAGGGGQGTRILHALAEQLRGELTQDSGAGTEWTLVFDPRPALETAAE
ncbi:sensor histidine kinase [Pseudoponticoccus marisrubri]|uniref:histidine kinase n=1 Tax=Pseudoponticoccus marisrubri TaxID=1685382 RepID=A0A0W7WFB5_9RHOB|nr:sensor histidine kinase [Pseudoponticoccus marisrubri]KUF09308.1 hypothetical protein AVJ23_17845 [Pseudoponticoccus marisrubri]